MRKSFIACTAALLAGLVAFTAPARAADDWPKGKKLTCIVPFAAGGSADTMARQLFKYWEPLLDANIIVSNRDGATGLLGTELFLKQPKDGTHMLIGTQMYMSAGVVLQDAKFSMDDFAVINFQQFDPSAITVLEDSKYKTFQDLVDDIKARPGQVKVGIMAGGAPHLAAVVLKEKLGLDYRVVNYDSGNGYRTALLGKHVDFVMSNANGDRALKGKARILAVADDQRNKIWPDSPTFNEVLGIKDFPKLGSARFIALHKEFKEKYPERFKKMVETYRQAFENPEYVKLRETSGEDSVSSYRGPEESDRMNHELHDLLERYKDRM
ncbi:MAG: tripartite tricarboxylate transporter substrate binding protein [Candidatus Accumulibacter sp.]|jgi:tripartite-type tricarboxylate transporter receptor subunit TctC|nr:tripartite tricarboxylate transporter substrate binding protein [Accumulibacter sp.]